MSFGINSVQLLGNCGKDPEVHTTNNGTRVANFTMATSEEWTDKRNGEKKKETQWHRVTVWGPMIDVVEKHVHKGSRLMITGKLTYREYEKDGRKQYSTEIVLQGPRADLVLFDHRDAPADRMPTRQPAAPQARSPARGAMDDDIPFAPEWR